MVRTLGKDRFAAFWRSSEPVADAFRTASNQSLDAWVHDWAVRTYGPLAVGPGLYGSEILFGLLTLLVAVSATAAIARGRRVA
jgi:hypothetical protein